MKGNAPIPLPSSQVRKICAGEPASPPRRGEIFSLLRQTLSRPTTDISTIEQNFAHTAGRLPYFTSDLVGGWRLGRCFPFLLRIFCCGDQVVPCSTRTVWVAGHARTWPWRAQPGWRGSNQPDLFLKSSHRQVRGCYVRPDNSIESGVRSLGCRLLNCSRIAWLSTAPPLAASLFGAPVKSSDWA